MQLRAGLLWYTCRPNKVDLLLLLRITPSCTLPTVWFGLKA